MGDVRAHAKAVGELTRLAVGQAHLILLALVVHLAEARHLRLAHVLEEGAFARRELRRADLQHVVADVHAMQLGVHAIARLRLQALLALLFRDGCAHFRDSRVGDVICSSFIACVTTWQLEGWLLRTAPALQVVALGAPVPRNRHRVAV